MATIRLLNHRNQVRNSLSSEIRHGHSKAQMCLMKILHTISTFSPSNPPSPSQKHEGLEFGMRNEDRGFGIDLNIRLRPPPKEIESPPAASGEGDSEVCEHQVCDSINIVENDNGDESEVVELEDTPNVQFQSSEFNNSRVLEEVRSEKENQIEAQEHNHHHEELRCLNLLIEAARLISGGFRDDESEPERLEFVEEVVHHKSAGAEPAPSESKNSRGLKRNECPTVDEYGNFEDTSPVVRSKRGRSQVLPYKYRDSILEPLARLSRHRSTTISSKRRSR